MARSTWIAAALAAGVAALVWTRRVVVKVGDEVWVKASDVQGIPPAALALIPGGTATVGIVTITNVEGPNLTGNAKGYLDTSGEPYDLPTGPVGPVGFPAAKVIKIMHPVAKTSGLKGW